jgi:oxygen-independent coproporphyrinogen-3 oxidase
MYPSLSLYLHIPFCRHRCAYCDFNTYTTLSDLQTRYAEALTAEIYQVADPMARPVHTIFFGGGTPSLMAPSDMQTIMTAVFDAFDVRQAAEISMEANPNTITRPYLDAMRQVGINRLSFGVQSVISTELALLERQHDFQTVVDAVATARAAGFENFNIDLIYGVPGQTLASWEQSVRAVLDFRPKHFSLYCLTIEEGTPMARWLHTGIMPAPDPDLAADQFDLARNLLGAAGYDHYEISNWAQPGYQCQHNLTYWRNGDYLGLGAGAHGHADGIRYAVVRQPRTYIKRIAAGGGSYPLSSAVAQSTKLERAEQISDTVITQLRLLNEGLDIAAFETQFDVSPREAFGTTLDELLEWRLLKVHENRLLLTERGQFLSNQVFYRLM